MGRVLAQAVPRHEAGLRHARLQNAERSNRDCEDGRLRDLGEPKLFLGTFKAKLRELVAERFVGFLEGVAGGRIFLR